MRTGRSTACEGCGELEGAPLNPIQGRSGADGLSYSDVMSNAEDDVNVPDPANLAEFFAGADQPRQEQSSFTPRQVAELIRQDRDAST